MANPYIFFAPISDNRILDLGEVFMVDIEQGWAYMKSGLIIKKLTEDDCAVLEAHCKIPQFATKKLLGVVCFLLAFASIALGGSFYIERQERIENEKIIAQMEEQNSLQIVEE